MRETKKLKRIIAVILITLIIIYIIYAVVLLLLNPNNVYILTKGELYAEDETVGYIIRNEQVIEDEENVNGIYKIASEGQKVAKDEYVFRYYKDSENELTNKINELDYKIQELLESENILPSADIKVIENQIEEKISKINLLSSFQEIKEYKSNIEELITKKINYISQLTNNEEIKSIINERNQYENQLNAGASYKTATMSGVVSYKVDGLEDKLKPDNLAIITDTYLEELDLKTGQIISSSNEYGKVIDNFKCYIAVVTDSELSKQAKVGDKVTLRISTTEEDEAQIVQINEGTGNRTIIFELNNMTQHLINYRKIAVDIIWWQESGYKVPNKAIITKNVNGHDLNYIIRNKNGVQTEILIKIEKQNDKFSIISSYETKELQELGFNEEDIKNYIKISNYDEIILNVENNEE